MRLRHRAFRSAAALGGLRLPAGLILATVAVFTVGRPSSAATEGGAPNLAFSAVPAGAQGEAGLGTPAGDPYRWLEGDSRTPAISQWIEAENKLARSYLTKLRHRDGFRHRLDHLWDFKADEAAGGIDPAIAGLEPRSEVTRDGRYRIVSKPGADGGEEIRVQDLSIPGAPFHPVAPGAKSRWDFVGSHGTLLYFVTNLGAVRSRVVAVDMSRGVPAASTVIAEADGELREARLTGGRLILNYVENGASAVRLFSRHGKFEGTAALPALGTVALGQVRGDGELLFAFSNMAMPTRLYRLDSSTGAVTELSRSTLPYHPSDYVVRRLFFKAKDGRSVPILLSHQKDLDFSKGAPTILFTDGAEESPAFSLLRFTWMDLGGVYAFVPAAGAGRSAGKSVAPDTLLSAAEFLIAERLTSPAKLGLYGEGAGAALAAAAANRRPGLFSAMLLRNGIFDSAAQPVEAGADYPATLLLTGGDVPPAQSFKFAAALQAARSGAKPHLIRVGNGSGNSTAAAKDEAADLWAFAAHHTRLSDTSPSRTAAAGSR